eukprot:13731749-Ditylum_brightwellii.AAC.1
MSTNLGNHKTSDLVQAVPRLHSDLKALKKITDYDTPPLMPLRGVDINHVIYRFDNASKGGSGTSFNTKKGTYYRIEIWGQNIGG